MNQNSAIILLLLLTFTFTSCVRDGESLEDCIRRMRIELRWIETAPVDNNETVHISVHSELTQTDSNLTSDIYGVDVDFQIGNYTLVGWEEFTNAQLDIENQTVSVETSAGNIASDPAIFSAGIATATVDETCNSIVIPLPMYRQVRPLVIEIDFTGAGIGLVESLQGTLTGIAVERLLSDGFPPVSRTDRPAARRNGSINYVFSSISPEGEGMWFGATHNIIGIDGNAAQNLTLTINYRDEELPLADSRATSQLTFDLTEQLAGFHTSDVDDPWYIILKIDVGISLEATIVDWISGTESWLTAQ